MALYSIWDWSRNSYRVYATSELVSVGEDPTPPRPSGVHLLGAVPDIHVKKKPRGGRFMGYSHVGRGEIVRDDKSTRAAHGGSLPAGLGSTGLGEVTIGPQRTRVYGVAALMAGAYGYFKPHAAGASRVRHALLYGAAATGAFVALDWLRDRLGGGS